MCGIVGYRGHNDAIKKTINCLEKLEYRGYDSAGIAYISLNDIIIKKEKGRIKNLKDNLNFDEQSNIAIAHTRWATHGESNQINAHPHNVGHITLVHNGIIENYLELKEELIVNGYDFVSETDTEVACAYIDYLYSKNNNKIEVINSISKYFKGSYALGILFDDELDSIYATRLDSPLIVGIKDDEYFIASDVPAILEYTDKYILIDNKEVVHINDTCTIYNNLNVVNKEINTFEFNIENNGKGNYEHYMLKEINEQPNIIYYLLNKYINNLEELPDLSKYNRIDIIGCGSAYHTGLIGKSLFEGYANTEVNCYVASEYRYQTNFYTDNTLVIFISQSGETADTLACLRKVKENNIDTLAIVNAVGSSIAREADNVIYIEAGLEIAVATTKAYTAQITILALLAIKKSNTNIETLITDINNIKDTISSLINDIDYVSIAEEIYKRDDIFFIGRLIDYAIALEGSLKLKEISYINSSTYPAGELKHGTISLIDEGTPVISIITDENIKDKTVSNVKEVKARGAISILVTNLDGMDDIIDNIIKVPTVNKFLQPIITIIPLQLLSYFVARKRGCDIDKPRNLAKSVTVE